MIRERWVQRYKGIRKLCTVTSYVSSPLLPGEMRLRALGSVVRQYTQVFQIAFLKFKVRRQCLLYLITTEVSLWSVSQEHGTWNVHTGSGHDQSSYLVGRGAKSFAGVNLTTHVHLVPRLRMSGGMPLLPYTSAWLGQEQIYDFYWSCVLTFLHRRCFKNWG